MKKILPGKERHYFWHEIKLEKMYVTSTGLSEVVGFRNRGMFKLMLSPFHNMLRTKKKTPPPFLNGPCLRRLYLHKQP